MTPYITRTLSVIVLPQGKPIFSETATIIGLEDEAAGCFVTVIQHTDTGEMKLGFDEHEWPVIRSAIDQMVSNAVQINKEPSAGTRG